MEISILGLKLNLEVLILIGIIYLIMVSHTFCGCSNIPGIIETFGTIANDVNKHVNVVTKKIADKHAITKDTEGFTGANTNYGQSAPYSLSHDHPINTSHWGQQDLVVTSGQPLPPAVKKILEREPQPVPLPEGELLMFANTPFKPECCPNTYSNSSGCACMTSEQYNYIISRSGNNVPYSEY
jgi:hypothetical protein